MMYNNKFVATVKANGKVLRELGDIVYLPFGCEYSILLKNLNTIRAQATITIDGEDVLNGSALVINPACDLEIERFLKDLNKGNRFKFIERSASVEQHRGVGATDGLIRVEWQFEIPQPVYTPRPQPWIQSSGFNVNGALRSVDYSNGDSTRAYAATAISNQIQSMGISAASAHVGTPTMDWAPANDAGITVPGSLSNQRFQTVASFPLEAQKHVIVLQLKGETVDNKVVAPVTVKHKPKCVTCGKINKATSKFCTNCGTSLELV